MYAAAFSEWAKILRTPSISNSTRVFLRIASTKKMWVTPYPLRVSAKKRAPVLFSTTTTTSQVIRIAPQLAAENLCSFWRTPVSLESDRSRAAGRMGRSASRGQARLLPRLLGSLFAFDWVEYTKKGISVSRKIKYKIG
jgi:hypothetical protein